MEDEDRTTPAELAVLPQLFHDDSEDEDFAGFSEQDEQDVDILFGLDYKTDCNRNVDYRANNVIYWRNFANSCSSTLVLFSYICFFFAHCFLVFIYWSYRSFTTNVCV